MLKEYLCTCVFDYSKDAGHSSHYRIPSAMNQNPHFQSSPRFIHCSETTLESLQKIQRNLSAKRHKYTHTANTSSSSSSFNLLTREIVRVQWIILGVVQFNLNQSPRQLIKLQFRCYQLIADLSITNVFHSLLTTFNILSVAHFIDHHHPAHTALVNIIPFAKILTNVFFSLYSFCSFAMMIATLTCLHSSDLTMLRWWLAWNTCVNRCLIPLLTLRVWLIIQNK